MPDPSSSLALTPTTSHRLQLRLLLLTNRLILHRAMHFNLAVQSSATTTHFGKCQLGISYGILSGRPVATGRIPAKCRS